jgi:DNA-binding transcriptional MerR regulator/methylmalonyl-CoA mutase cobalamin-binding subunit
MLLAKYTVNEAEERTKVPATTLRQWERRYGFPAPERTESGYRLYSDEDISLIEEMRRHIASGVAASRAAELAKAERRRGDGPRPLAELQTELLAALLDLNETRADGVMSEAHALHPVNAVMLGLIQATMVEIGTRWHQGKLSTTTEHYASAYMNGRLRSLLALSGDSRTGATAVVACAPLEQHELGPLILAVMLRRAGYRVFYLGANTPVADLHDMVQALRPGGVFISASTALAVGGLEASRELLGGMNTLVVYGGRAFGETPGLAERLGGHYLGPDAEGAVERFHERLSAGA